MTHMGFHGNVSFGVRSSISSSVCTHSSRLTMQPLHPVSACTPPNTHSYLLNPFYRPADEKLKPRQAVQEIEIYIIHRHLRLCFSGPGPKEGTLYTALRLKTISAPSLAGHAPISISNIFTTVIIRITPSLPSAHTDLIIYSFYYCSLHKVYCHSIYFINLFNS